MRGLLVRTIYPFGGYIVLCRRYQYPDALAKLLLAQQDMLNAWVSRSKSQPLSFILRLRIGDGLNEGAGEDDGAEEIARTLVESVVALSGRWVSLNAHCDFSLFQMLAPVVSAKAEILEEVNLIMTSLPVHGPVPTITWSKDFGSKLASFSLAGGPILYIPDFSGKWKTLTKLSYHQSPFQYRDQPFLTFHDVYNILACCPAMRILSFSIGNPLHSRPFDRERPRTVLRLPNLEELFLDSCTITDFHLLDELLADNLKEFAVAGRSTSEGSGWDHINEFIERSRPPLKQISIRGTPITPEQLVNCLVLVPNVRYLSLDGRVFDDFVVSRLLWRPNDALNMDDNLLPFLDKLVVTDCAVDSRFVMGVSLMVHSRLISHNVVELGLMLNCGTDAEVLEWRRGGPKGGWILSLSPWRNKWVLTTILYMTHLYRTTSVEVFLLSLYRTNSNLCWINNTTMSRDCFVEQGTHSTVYIYIYIYIGHR